MKLQELMEYKDQVNKILANFNLEMVVWAEEYDDDFSDNGIKIKDIDDFKNKVREFSLIHVGDESASYYWCGNKHSKWLT